jgi:cyclohexanone monooxygenase
MSRRKFFGVLARTVNSRMQQHWHHEIDTTVGAEDTWVAHVGAAAARTLYPRAASWYMEANVPGKQRVFAPHLAGVAVYDAECADVAAPGYAGFVLSP